MSRYLTRATQIAIDLLMLSAAFWLAFLFRFELNVRGAWVGIAQINWWYVVLVEYVVLAVMGVPNQSWRYVGLRDVTRVTFAVGVASAILLALRLWDPLPGINLFALPLGALAMNTVLAFVMLVGVRALRRTIGEQRERRRAGRGGARTRVLLIGAGQAGVMVARELRARPDLGLDAVGFLDDDRLKVGSQIAGLSVLGTTDRIAEIAERKRAARVLITIANAPGPDIRRITLRCKEAGLDTKIIPGIYEIVGERVNLSRIRDVAIEDLLGREQVVLDEDEIERSITDRTVLITGAGGSIGSELCRQAARFAPARLILVERFENSLFEIHRELVAAFPDLAIEPCVADLCDAPRMAQIFATRRPDVVFHAAAHKHVPMMELNPGEAIKNNVGGTRMVANLAHEHGVGRFVMISTDKAVNPTSVMGASKRVAEIYIQALSQRSSTRFVTVRFGNVLGSNGSVIPIFKEQIARGGPLTITHPEMRRFFMTIPEASQLVLQAGAMGDGGEIFILDMGAPVKIVDLANDLIRLSGLRPGEDIELAFSGVRPGEKLFEELATDSESAGKTKHPKIYIGRIAKQPWDATAVAIERLFEVAASADADLIRGALGAVVPEYGPSPTEASTDVDELVPEPPLRGDIPTSRRTEPRMAAVVVA